MKRRSATVRKTYDLSIKIASAVASLIALVLLGWILTVVALKGSAALGVDFFTKLPEPPGEVGGGLANAIIGTLLMTLLATALAVPTGAMAGVYLAEFGGRGHFANAVRFVANTLMGTPSIIVGIFVYAILVMPVGHFSGYAGAVALAIIMLPVICRTTEDMLSLVPNGLRESALALGAPRWRVTLGIVFRAAKSGLITAALLAVARVSGETAPLLFTALNSPYWVDSLNRPTANLTVTIYNYAMSPYSDWEQIAWGASLVITAAVLAATLATRFILRERKRSL